MTATGDILNSLINAFLEAGKIEWGIFISALLYIIFIANERSIGWLFGIIASLLSVYLCYAGNLFLESALNVFYVFIGFYGWYQWVYGSKEQTELPISRLSFSKNMLLLVIGVITWIPFGFVAHNYSTQALPYLDAFITAFSLVATWMTAKKNIENWIYWIIIDSAGILLFSFRGFYLLALLNIIYTSMAIAGYILWRKKLRQSA